ncbi:MAG: preprotein translocase subunit SecE [Bacteroidota bacterium]
MDKLRAYIKESYTELMTKVSWPTWDELTNSAIVVAVAALIMALLVFGMDKSASLILGTFYQAF